MPVRPRQQTSMCWHLQRPAQAGPQTCALRVHHGVRVQMRRTVPVVHWLTWLPRSVTLSPPEPPPLHAHPRRLGAHALSVMPVLHACMPCISSVFRSLPSLGSGRCLFRIARKVPGAGHALVSAASPLASHTLRIQVCVYKAKQQQSTLVPELRVQVGVCQRAPRTVTTCNTVCGPALVASLLELCVVVTYLGRDVVPPVRCWWGSRGRPSWRTCPRVQPPPR